MNFEENRPENSRTLRAFVLEKFSRRQRISLEPGGKSNLLFRMAKVKHIGLIKFKATTTEEQIDSLFENLLDLSESIEGLEDYVSGPNSSPEGLNQEFTHAFVMTFSDATARDAYLPHPEHQRFKNILSPLVESVIVVDFEV